MESVQHVSKIQYVYLLKKYKKLNVWREAVKYWLISASNIDLPSVTCVAPPEEQQVMLETCRGP
jgi:hypothetical protein